MTLLSRAPLIACLLAPGVFAQTPPAAAVAADAAAARSAGVPAHVEQPRAFGHTVGDVLVQRVRLSGDHGPVAVTRPLAPGRIGLWLERRPVRETRDADGARWLVIEYQLINAPQALTALALPALDIATSGPLLSVPAWPFSAAPLTPRTAFAPEGGLGALQPDRPAPAIDTVPIRRRIGLWGALCAASLLAWGGWFVWRNGHARRNQPFARALRELRGLPDDAPGAWQALHRAFDRTAGRTLQPASLPRLFERAPQYASLRSDIERFYAQSAERFFGSGPQGDPLPLHRLARRLRSLEKRHET